jgi:hypothetical protein
VTGVLPAGRISIARTPPTVAAFRDVAHAITSDESFEIADLSDEGWRVSEAAMRG